MNCIESNNLHHDSECMVVAVGGGVFAVTGGGGGCGDGRALFLVLSFIVVVVVVVVVVCGDGDGSDGVYSQFCFSMGFLFFITVTLCDWIYVLRLEHTDVRTGRTF